MYVFMEECGADFEPPRNAVCPECYQEHEDFWQQTMQARIHDAADGEAGDLSLAVALQNQRSENDVDSGVLDLLGDTTGPQKWLVASLDKTIRLQLGL